MDKTVPALTINPSEETILVGSISVRFLVTGDDSSQSAALFEFTVPKGAKLPSLPHSHDAYEETVYGLSGMLTWIVDGQQYEVEQGQALCIPRGAVHSFVNHGQEEARLLVTISPAALGPAFFRETAEIINAAAGGPPDPIKMAGVLRRHGLTPAPPPA